MFLGYDSSIAETTYGKKEFKQENKSELLQGAKEEGNAAYKSLWTDEAALYQVRLLPCYSSWQQLPKIIGEAFTWYLIPL